MRTCVSYFEIQRSRGKEGNARFANEGHLRFVSVAFGLWTLEGEVRERAFFHFLKFVMNFLSGVVSICHSFGSKCKGPGFSLQFLFFSGSLASWTLQPKVEGPEVGAPMVSKEQRTRTKNKAVF